MINRLLITLLLILPTLLAACAGGSAGSDSGADATPRPGFITSLTLVDAETGSALPNIGPLEQGATLDTHALGLRRVELRAEGSEMSKVEFVLDGESYTDEQAPYSISPMEATDWRLRSGRHTLRATPYSADGSAATPLNMTFSVTAPNYDRYLYVFRTSAIDVFDIDRDHKLTKSLKLPGGIERIWGATAHAASHKLYISYHGHDTEGHFETGLLAYDLGTEQILWKKLYKPFVDSPAITADGKTIYLSSGEATDRGTFWFVINANDGTVRDTIEVYRGAHNTIIGRSGERVYLASVRYPYLVIADTATNEIVKKVGPFRDGIRPFTVNSQETLAFVNVNHFLGFEVGDIATGKVLHSVHVEGFPEGPWTDPLQVQSHGIALSPDEKEVWVVDGKNRRVHLYDVVGLPVKKPTYITSIELPAPPNWVQFSRDGRFAYTSGGEVIDARMRQVVAKTSYAKVRIQIDFLDDQPARAYVRYGLGYANW